MDSKTVPGKNDITRRRFCNGVLLASSALALGANSLKVADAAQLEPQVAYPPMKIEGAESVIPGSFLYFSYPTPRDAAVLVRASDGQFAAYSRKCAPSAPSVNNS